MSCLRIRRLVLEQFAAILAGMGKERVELNLENIDARIIVFVGPIGTGKTYILSHLQPYATVGSLDIRNTDDPIIEGKDGLKIIEYEKDNHIYIITHTYLWTGKSHTKKHSILKDEIELNPNGNLSSFMEVIQLEFGIDQSFLRLIRIGDNVSNFINMKATERKSFIASLLRDTETYLYLYKCWSNDLKTINTKVNILMNKITTFSKVPLEELKKEMNDLEEDRKDLLSLIDQYKEKRANYKAETNSILKGETINDYRNMIIILKDQVKIMDEERSSILNSLEEYKEFPPENEVSKRIGKTDNELSNITEKIQSLTDAYENCMLRLNKTRDKRAIMGDKNHIDILQEQYQSLMKQMEDMEESVKGFQCKYSTSYLSRILEDLNSMNIILNDIGNYDKKEISFVYNSDSSIVEYSEKKVNILTARKIKVQRLMSNLTYSDSYEPTQLMYLPPFCPTESCPYHKTHPCTIKRLNGEGISIEPQLLAYQNELKDLDIEIYKYSDYPLLYGKIKSLKNYWRDLSDVLINIKALLITDLKKVIETSHYQQWYSYDKIIDTMDMIEKRDMYYEMTEKVKAIRNELSQFDLKQHENLDELIIKLEEERSGLACEIEKCEKEKVDIQNQLTLLNDIYMKLSSKNDLKHRLSELEEERKRIVDQITDREKNDHILEDNCNLITQLDRKIVESEGQLSELIKGIDDRRTKINDISYTSKELDGLLEEQKWMTYMVDAVGSKKGIPMKMVKIFFDSCRDSINEMLYMVSGDDFEITDFRIGEKEFTIPYMVNGIVTDDISKASQGQSSLVSLALSFALVKELALKGSNDQSCYNIPLLDEPDAPLNRSDKPKLLSILLKYLEDIQSEQCFIITHSEDLLVNTSIPTQFISTSTGESINTDRYPNTIYL